MFLIFWNRQSPAKAEKIQLTGALRVMAHCGNVYACNFIGKRYDTGNKLGYPTVP